MKRLEFHISYRCNHNCIFCSEYDRLNAHANHPLSLMQIKAILIDRRKKWFNHVNFTGGEPTLIPGFLELLRFTKKLGYTIYVGTNGTMFASEEFAKEALQYIDELSLSIHWFDAKSAEEQTGNKHHFDIFDTSISKHIARHQQANNFFFANIVLNQKNYRDTVKILAYIKSSGYPVKQVLISNIAPEGLAEHDFAKLVFDLHEFQEYIPAIVNYCDSSWLTLRFFWLPTCILADEFASYANDAHWEWRNTIERFTDADGKVKLIDIYTPDNSRKRTFVEKCQSCKWKERPCTGIFAKYLEHHEF